jgi:hypothetical protein
MLPDIFMAVIGILFMLFCVLTFVVVYWPETPAPVPDMR